MHEGSAGISGGPEGQVFGRHRQAWFTWTRMRRARAGTPQAGRGHAGRTSRTRRTAQDTCLAQGARQHKTHDSTRRTTAQDARQHKSHNSTRHTAAQGTHSSTRHPQHKAHSSTTHTDSTRHAAQPLDTALVTARDTAHDTRNKMRREAVQHGTRRHNTRGRRIRGHEAQRPAQEYQGNDGSADTRTRRALLAALVYVAHSFIHGGSPRGRGRGPPERKNGGNA